MFQRSRAARCDFSDSDLTYADFCYADLSTADFRRARFMRTRMHRAHQQQTRWGDRSGILERDEELYAAETRARTAPEPNLNALTTSRGITMSVANTTRAVNITPPQQAAGSRQPVAGRQPGGGVRRPRLALPPGGELPADAGPRR